MIGLGHTRCCKESLRTEMADVVVGNSTTPHEPLAGFGRSPAPWDKDMVGSVYVLRADGWPLAPDHLEAVCEYMKQKVEALPLSATADIDTTAPVPGYEDILNSVNKTAFLEFFIEYKASKAMTNPIWRDLMIRMSRSTSPSNPPWPIDTRHRMLRHESLL
jgi:hypothetical protein